MIFGNYEPVSDGSVNLIREKVDTENAINRLFRGLSEVCTLGSG